jgi:hypothetical protein
VWTQSGDKIGWSKTPYLWASNTKVDFKDGDLSTDFTYYGPMAGFNFRF